MVYNPLPPYDALQNRLIDFQTMQQLRRFARHWDLVGNSGNFINSTPLLWTASRKEEPLSGDAFQGFWAFSQWLHRELGRTDSIALTRLMELLFRYLTSVRGLDPATVAQAVWKDYLAPGNRHDKPSFLKDFLPDAAAEVRPNRQRNSTLKRQNRHSAASATTASSGNAWEDNL